MFQFELDSKTKRIIASLMVNFLFSWMILPLTIPPFRLFTFRELMETLLWQGIAAVGWPFAILGGIVNLFLQGNKSDLGSFLIILIYPVMLLLLIFVLFSKRSKRWILILLHILIMVSFAAVWYKVLNGYNFMVG